MGSRESVGLVSDVGRNRFDSRLRKRSKDGRESDAVNDGGDFDLLEVDQAKVDVVDDQGHTSGQGDAVVVEQFGSVRDDRDGRAHGNRAMAGSPVHEASAVGGHEEVAAQPLVVSVVSFVSLRRGARSQRTKVWRSWRSWVSPADGLSKYIKIPRKESAVSRHARRRIRRVVVSPSPAYLCNGGHLAFQKRAAAVVVDVVADQMIHKLRLSREKEERRSKERPRRWKAD